MRWIEIGSIDWFLNLKPRNKQVFYICQAFVWPVQLTKHFSLHFMACMLTILKWQVDYYCAGFPRLHYVSFFSLCHFGTSIHLHHQLNGTCVKMFVDQHSQHHQVNHHQVSGPFLRQPILSSSCLSPSRISTGRLSVDLWKQTSVTQL